MKRPLSSECHGDKVKKHPKGAEATTLGCDYSGYSFQKDAVLVETVETAMDPSEFFQRFIAKRKPCILQTSATTTTTTTTTTPLPSISLPDLVTVAGQEVRVYGKYQTFR